MTVAPDLARKLAEQGDQPDPIPGLDPDTKTCDHCGAEFHRSTRRSRAAFAKRRFCSEACAHRGIPRPGTRGPRSGLPAESRTCEHCGQLYHRMIGQARSTFAKRRFCSRTCAAAGIDRPGQGRRTHCRSGRHKLPDTDGPRACNECRQERERGQRPTRPRKPPAKKTPPIRAAIATQPELPVWRPAGFPPTPNTRPRAS
ncbi:hypothetical protein [Pseudonocardia zijingensis]|uniref:Uncharacterized protein n=1 Tax=Pseudonocardia zijingensis TaxID=153376 RepID=A0ABP3YQI5_9PSEU